MHKNAALKILRFCSSWTAF